MNSCLNGHIFLKCSLISCSIIFAIYSIEKWSIIDGWNKIIFDKFTNVTCGISTKQIDYDNFQLSLLSQCQSFVALVDGKLKRLEKEFGKLDENISIHIENDRKDVKDFGIHIQTEAVKTMLIEKEDYWRKIELSKFTKLMQMRLYNLQNPSDCKKAKKLNCVTNDDFCGFGCQIHSLSYCLIVGYSQKRVVLPVFEKWRYSPDGWNEYFLPLTNCSKNDTLNEDEKNKTDSVEILNVPWYDYKLPTLPPAFPAEFAETLIKTHPDPSLFWISQFIEYIMRFTPNMRNYIEDEKRMLNFSTPIVGIHIRRTDKLVHETQLFEVEEYMKHISTWFDIRLPNKNVTRRVYLATDEPEVIRQIISKYTDYEFLFDGEGAVRAKSDRYSNSSLMDIITSLHLLSNCDFVVCTFSSNVCRLVYELMQIVKNGDYTNSVISLDTIFYFYGQQNRQQIAIIEHHSDGEEIELQVGDILDVDTPMVIINEKNQFDGLTTGKNLRTNKFGKYPTFKVKELWRIVDFPKYV